MTSRPLPKGAPQHLPWENNLPIGIGANFHDDPICRANLRRSHTLGMDFAADHAPHTRYTFNGVPGDNSWSYQTTSQTTIGAAAAAAAAALSGPNASTGTAAAAAAAAADESVQVRFLGYFREEVRESAVERVRVRKVGISFCPADGTISIREAHQPNSGIVQGAILSRRRVPRDPHGPASDVLTLADFAIGGSVSIYGGTYHIVDCDESSRRYLRDVCGRSDVPDLPAPWPEEDDAYNATVQRRMRTSARKLIPTADMDHKRVTEQLISGIISKRAPDEVATAQQFLANKINEHLQFAAYWDDRGKISGDLRLCVIRYFLENDTVEIIEQRPENAGREGGAKLLMRQRVARDGVDPLEAKAQHNTYGVVLKRDFLEAKDFRVGETYVIHGRPYVVYDADAFTREYARTKLGVELRAAVDISDVLNRGKAAPVVHLPPPHNGFGVEEDSIGNCRSLLLKPPRVDIAKQEAENGRVMLFSATFEPPIAPEDAGREFVVAFHRARDEVEVTERVVRNSGIVGGKFLARGRHLKRLPDGREVPFQPSDFVAGGSVAICGHRFRLLQLDERSQRIAAGVSEPVTEARVRELLVLFKVLLQTKFLRIHEAYRAIAPSGALTAAEVKAFFRQSSATVTDDEAALLVVQMAPGGGGVVSFDDFVRVMQVPNSSNVDESTLRPAAIKEVRMDCDASVLGATRAAADAAEYRSLRAQLAAKVVQRRGTVQEVFRMLAGQSSNARLNRRAFRVALRDLLHFNVSRKAEQMLEDMLFVGAEDANGDITFKQFHEFIEAS